MEVKEWGNSFLQLKTDLARNQKTELIEFNLDQIIELLPFSSPLEENHSKEIIKIYDSLIELENFAGLQMNWQVNREETNCSFVYGSLLFHGIFASLNYPKELNYHQKRKDISENELDKINHLCIFQSSGHGEEPVDTGFLKNDASKRVYLYDFGFLFSLELNLDDYWNALFHARGILYWQYFYADPKKVFNSLNSIPANSENTIYLSDGEEEDRWNKGKSKYEILVHQLEMNLFVLKEIFSENKYSTFERVVESYIDLLSEW